MSNDLCQGCRWTRNDFNNVNATCRHDRSVMTPKPKEEGMESPYSDNWYCDICGGFFQREDAGHISEDEGEVDVCEECHERQFDTSKGEILH